MKVLMIIPRFILGGAETMCENLSCSLADLGVEVEIASLFTYHSAITERLEARGIKIHYLDKKWGMDLSMYGKLRRLYRQVKPDVIHTHLYVTKYAIPAAMGLGMKRIHTMHSLAGEENRTGGGMLLNRIFFACCGVKVVALSDRIRDTICATYHKKAEKIPVVYNGVPMDRCLPKTEYRQGDDLRILHIGRFMPEKNQIQLIRAMEQVHGRHPGAALTIVGEGELEPRIRSVLEEGDGHPYINLAPVTGNVYPLYHEADIFALPSLYEGMPMTVIEAMGTGLPVLAGRVGGIPDMIEDGVSGLLCSPESEDIAAGLCRLLEDDKLRETLGRNALRESANLSADKMAEAYRRIYEG